MEVITALQSAASPALDSFMLFVTNLGSEEVYVALLVTVFVGLDANVGRRLALYFLAGVYGMEIFKGVVDAPRPYELDPSVVRNAAAAETAPGPSFPSGHALSAMLFWGLAASYVRRSWFSLVAALIVGLIAVSRVYLGVHFPLDVIVGLAVGFLFVVAGRALDRVKWRLGRTWMLVLGLLLPLALHLLLPTENSGLYLGAFAAFIVGPELVPHRTDGAPWQRAVLTLLGLALVFAALLGSSALIPDAVRHSSLGSFVRYLLIGGVGTVLVPLLGRALRLVPRTPLRQVAGGAPATAK